MSLIDVVVLIKQTYRFKNGLAAMEYAVMLGAIILAIAAVVKIVGSNLNNLLGNLGAKLG